MKLTPLLALVLVGSAHAAGLSGRVVNVADGDTVTVLDASMSQHKIRLSGIDAPEKRQPFGTYCRGVTASMVAGRTVSVDVEGTDRYRRSIGTILVNGQDINREVVRQGCAWAYTRYSTKYVSDEAMAHRGRVGLWADPHAMAPWDFRHR